MGQTRQEDRAVTQPELPIDLPSEQPHPDDVELERATDGEQQWERSEGR